MDLLSEIRRTFDHARWADRIVLAALNSCAAPTETWREMGHILGATETWLSRLERRPSRLPVWPTETPESLVRFCEQIHADFSTYLTTLNEVSLGRAIPYTNSAGKSFETPVNDILHHVVLHAQYHRGKINQLLRQAGLNPAPTDYIAFVRGVPAATTARS